MARTPQLEQDSQVDSLPPMKERRVQIRCLPTVGDHWHDGEWEGDCRSRDTVPGNELGRAYSRPTTGTGMPPEERFGHAPIRGVPQRCPLDEIASFVVDSSRSYATIILLESIILLFQPPK